MPIGDLFVSDVTRDIPPVVYFHEQSPAKLAAEVSEYIITGGWPEDHPNRRRVPDGIHEQYVRLFSRMAAELDKPGGPELPNAWISGFYGSGKSIFAKLLGLALDGVSLPDGTALAEALLRRDTSPRSQELRKAWNELRQRVEPLAVVFDIGGIARDNEHIHSACIRQVQRRLGYCSTEPLVADFELDLERDGEWDRFEAVALETLGRPWAEVKDRALAEEDFSLVMSALYPERYTDPMSWYGSRVGTHQRSESPEEAVAAIRDMIGFRRNGATLFLVIDEVSQYVLSNKDRIDRLRAFATALGATMKGKAWLLALGQQKLDEEADDSFLVWAKDRFPPKLRVHLSATNIRDVVHKRLLQKRPEAEQRLRELFDKHRHDLKLFAYECKEVTTDELIEVYPLLPGHIDLLLQITSALRTRSARSQGDDQAIRGLLQLLGELFRDQKLADKPVGSLVTLDQIYEVQRTALDSDVQASMARILSQCADDENGLLIRAAKVVALLELIQDTLPTDDKLVAQCLYDRLDRGSRQSEVTEALEELRRRNLLGFSEKLGYKIQSTAGEEWERDRRDIPVAGETKSEIVQDGLKNLLAEPDRPRLQGRPFPWAAVFSDGRKFADASLLDPRDEASVRVDFRYLILQERTESEWIRRSEESALRDRIVWVCGDAGQVDQQAQELARSRAMIRKLKPRRESLSAARKLLLQQEENRAEDLEQETREAIAAAWMAGRFYFRGQAIPPGEHGAAFASSLLAVASRLLSDLYPHFVPTIVAPSELLQLVELELSGPSPKFLGAELGILELDAGRHVPASSGVVPRRVLEHIESEGGVGGATLLSHFGAPPYGYTANVVKACVAGLLRAGKLRIQPEGEDEITAPRDTGARDLFEKDRAFKRAVLFPAGEDDIGFQARARICRFFKQHLQHSIDREDHLIADAVAQYFPGLAQRLREVEKRLVGMPGPPATPDQFLGLQGALEDCIRACRRTKYTVQRVKEHLDALREGTALVNLYEAELTPAAAQAVREASEVQEHHVAQLLAAGAMATEIEKAAKRVQERLSGTRPWQGISGLEPDLEAIRGAYVVERTRLLEWQERLAEQARVRVKVREGFSTITGEHSHRVLRPLSEVLTETTAEAVAPPLVALKAVFEPALAKAEEEANDRLDEILSEGDRPLVVKVDLNLRNRELSTEPEVEALVGEIRDRLLERIRSGARVRLV